MSIDEFREKYVTIPIKAYEIFGKPFREKIEKLEKEVVLARRARARV